MGTARILTLSLANSHRFVGENFSEHDELNALLSDEQYCHTILYPGEGATLPDDAKNMLQAKQKLRVILLDGTWKKAYKMWQLSTNLHALPLIRLPENLHGNYRIRKAPNDNSLSTVEAGFHLLSLLEPEQDFVPLIEAFNQMIEFQIRQMPPGVFEKNYLS